MATGNLVFRAGDDAYEAVRRDGFSVANIGTFAGASGGAKWLVLSQLDRVLATEVLPRLDGDVHLIGTSIGAWRFCCYAQADPLAAIERFENAYVDQSYSDKPDIDEITRKSRDIMDVLLGSNGVEEILAHPHLRTHVMAVRAKHLTASEKRPSLMLGLAAAATANVFSRSSLRFFFERALFFDERAQPPFMAVDEFPIQRIPLSRENLADAVVATGSIPMVLRGVANVAGAAAGVYRDGGVIDYHLDLPHAATGRICLYPHFFSRAIPGWFDKKLRRDASALNMSRTILICPSDKFVSTLPGGKIPDRRDFLSFEPAERVRRWRSVIRSCAALADELNDVLQTDQLAARLQRY